MSDVFLDELRFYSGDFRGEECRVCKVEAYIGSGSRGRARPFPHKEDCPAVQLATAIRARDAAVAQAGKYREALRPLAEQSIDASTYAGVYEGDHHDARRLCGWCERITIGDIKRARAALATPATDGKERK